jgi:hypothetical protein
MDAGPSIVSLDPPEALPGQPAAAPEAGLRFVCDNEPGFERRSFWECFD